MFSNNFIRLNSVASSGIRRLNSALRCGYSAFALLLVILLLCIPNSRSFASDATLDLEPYAGKVVYLDFWASWCKPCRASFPFMHDISEEFGDDLAVVAVNLDKKRELAEVFLTDFDVNFDVIYDPEGVIASEYELKGMPTSFLINRSGELIAQHIGFRKTDVVKLRTAIKAEVKRQ